MKEYLKDYPEFRDNSLTYEYAFPSNVQLTPQSIHQFVKDGINKKIEQYNPSALPQKLRRFSRPVVAKNFKEKIIDNSLSQILMVWAEHCPSCKKFSPAYEELQKENLELVGGLFAEETGQDVMFNNLNREKNDIKGYKNFTTTPIFGLYRAGFKEWPIFYKGNTMNKKIMQDFFKISLQFDVMENNIVENLLSNISSRYIGNTNLDQFYKDIQEI